jgi:hypothetical protein
MIDNSDMNWLWREKSQLFQTSEKYKRVLIKKQLYIWVEGRFVSFKIEGHLTNAWI